MNRREFIETACLTGMGIVAGSSILNSFGIASLKATPRPGVVRGNREIPLKLDETPDLQTVGGAYHFEIEELDKNLLVARTGEDTFVTVNIKCTHKGCDVKYDNTSTTQMFACPCHDSKFDLEGNPKSGPAKKPLGSYHTTFKNGEILILVPVDGDAPVNSGDSTIKVTKDSTMKK